MIRMNILWSPFEPFCLTLFFNLIYKTPVFWLGYLVIYIFMHKFGLFPIVFGFSSSQRLNWLYFLLPVFVFGIGNGTMSEIVRYLREEIGRVFSEDYICTAQAKGASFDHGDYHHRCPFCPVREPASKNSIHHCESKGIKGVMEMMKKYSQASAGN